MPIFTPDDLKGAGTEVGSFRLTGGSATRTFTFTNLNSGSVYFFIEQAAGRNELGRIPENTTDYTTGSFDTPYGGLSEDNIVQNKFKTGLVIPSGISGCKFIPVDTSGTGRIIFRGTGNLTFEWSQLFN